MENNMTQATPADLSIQELESAVITCLLLTPHTIPDVAPWLTPQMFSCPESAFIYQAILTQYERGEQPDYITTEAEMRRSDRELFDKTGGIDWLGATLWRIRHTDNLTVYATEIKNNYLFRLMNRLFANLQQKTQLAETDPFALLAEADSSLLEIRELMKQKEPLQSLSQVGSETIRVHRERSQQKLSDYTVCTGFDDLDAIFGGFQSGEMQVLAGQPGDGKTAIALQIAMNAAKNQKQVIYFSIEMSKDQLSNRLFCGETSINPSRLRMSTLTANDFKELETVNKQWQSLPFRLDYTSVNTVENIRAQTLLAKRQGGCDLIIVDYLQLLTGKPRYGENLEQLVARNAKTLKQLAMEAECVVLVISQMNRASENRLEKQNKPQLSDLRSSGVIEQAADGVTFIYRPDRHGFSHDPDTKESLVGKCQLIVRKNRHGIVGTVTLRHNGSFTLFMNQ